MATSRKKKTSPGPKKKPPTKAKALSRSKAKRKPPRKRKKKASGFWGRMGKYLLLLTIVTIFLGTFSVTGLFWYYSSTIPDLSQIDNYHPKLVTKIYTEDGRLIGELFEERRTLIPFEEIPKVMIQAILAAEDAEFYRHEGLDYLGLVRAIYYNVKAGHFSQGASTITQQVVKNIILTPEKTIKRKVQEVILARQLEQHLEKDEILYLYLSEIYFGHGRYGVEEAARFYFGKSVTDINLSEAAVLAGIVQAPEKLSPRKHMNAAFKRRNYVLSEMFSKGFITEKEYQAAMAASIQLAKKPFPYKNKAPYYTAYVRQQLINRLGRDKVYNGGLDVTVAMDYDAQQIATKAAHKGLQEYDQRHNLFRPIRHLTKKEIKAHLKKQAKKKIKSQVRYKGVITKVSKAGVRVKVGKVEGPLRMSPKSRYNPDKKPLAKLFKEGDLLEVSWISPKKREKDSDAVFRFADSPQVAVVVMDLKTRQLVALVGGYDYKESAFNRAVQARRQTGSTFKPFVYGAALQSKEITAASILMDSPTVFKLDGNKEWNPQNSDGKYLGPLTARQGLAKSRNVIAVQVLERTGIRKTQKFAQQAGITSPLVNNLTMALGSSELTPLELMAGFSTFASQGVAGEPIVIMEVTNSNGKVLFQNKGDSKQVIAPELAYLITDLLTSVVRNGTGKKALKLKRPVAGKTGTTNKSRDAWFSGYTPQFLTTVWVGYDNNRPLGKKEYGSKTALPIWLYTMKNLHKGIPVRDFGSPPRSLIKVGIDKKSGLKSKESGDGTIRELFLPGTAPDKFAPNGEEKNRDDYLLQYP